MKSTGPEETNFRDLRKDSGQYRLKMDRAEKSLYSGTIPENAGYGGRNQGG